MISFQISIFNSVSFPGNNLNSVVISFQISIFNSLQGAAVFDNDVVISFQISIFNSTNFGKCCFLLVYEFYI